MAGSIPRLTVFDLRERLESGEEFAILDVREPFEREIALIRVSEGVVDLHAPMGSVTQRVEQLRLMAGGLPVVVYCHHGVRSLMVAEWLLSQGFTDLFNLEGGIDAWSLGIDPKTPRY